SALEAAGHAVHVSDVCFARDPHAAALGAVRAFHPDVIGIGVRNIDNSDSIALRHYTPEAASLAAELRSAAPSATVVAGGAAFGVAPEALLEALDLRYAVAGDGERATVAVVNDLAAGREPGQIPGVVRRVNGRARLTPPGGD